MIPFTALQVSKKKGEEISGRRMRKKKKERMVKIERRKEKEEVEH